MADERIYTIPLRKEILKVPAYQRTKKAVSATRQFLIKHTKTKDIILGQHLNKELHKHGRQNPPPRIKVKVYKFKEKLIADTIDAPIMKEEEKKKTIGEKLKEKVTGKKEETPQEKEEQQKKEVLEKPQEKTPQKAQVMSGKIQPQDKAGEKKGKKELFPKDEKSKNVKKK